jgi:hypothetical protein
MFMQVMAGMIYFSMSLKDMIVMAGHNGIFPIAYEEI